MCLGLPGRVLSVEGLVARVDFWGTQREVRLEYLDAPVAPGDLVMTHVGFALRLIPEHEVGPTLALYEQLLAEAGAEG